MLIIFLKVFTVNTELGLVKIKMLFNVIPINIKEEQIINDVVSFLKMRFNVDVTVSRKISLGEILKYYNESRKQINAVELLKTMQFRMVSDPSVRYILFIDSDAYINELSYVFGISKPGWGGIVFLKRLNPLFYGYPFNINLYTIRVIKEVLHQLGFSLGLSYCINRRCVMSYIKSIYDLDLKTVFLCKKCQVELERLHPGILRII